MTHPKYGIYIYPAMAELDFAGPYGVFSMSNVIREMDPHVVLIAETLDPVQGLGGLRVVPDVTLQDCPDLDVLLIPGAAETSHFARDTNRFATWITDQAQTVTFMTAVCTGAIILKKMGLLEGRKATTHWMNVDELSADGTTTVLPDARYVRDGNRVTSQGVSAGIDMALWIVGQLHDPAHARAVRRIMQYDPAPPYTAEVA